jgi:hypothetical protein
LAVFFHALDFDFRTGYTQLVGCDLEIIGALQRSAQTTANPHIKHLRKRALYIENNGHWRRG